MAGDGRSSRRTIVLSDAHGYPSLIEDALAHACFEPARDRLIFAGDLVDRGPDSARCLDLIESAAETALFGNHDVCAMLGSPLEPTVGGDDLSGPLVERFRGDRRWRFAAAVGGVLVTHAGLSSEVLGMIGGEHALDAGFLADEIDRWARDEMESALALGYLDDEGLLGMSGPLWFRPSARFPQEIPEGLTQVAGHTPVESAAGDVGQLGMYLIDPGTYGGPPRRWRCRYAVIDAMGVRVVSAG